MRIVVCGGRDFNEPAYVGRMLTILHQKYGVCEVIHGAARGADNCAGLWAKVTGVKETAVPANWAEHGKRAGPLRNKKMLEMKPDAVVAFPGGRGTKDMVDRAERAGIKVWRVLAPGKRDGGPSRA